MLRLSSPRASLPSFLGIAMSASKTSLTDKQTKNGTSKYVLERCASINEYYDIAFKVSISPPSSDSCVSFIPPLELFFGGGNISVDTMRRQ